MAEKGNPAGPPLSIFFVRTGNVEQVTPVVKTDEDWKALLAPETFAIARGKGTEYAFTGKYHDWKAPGIYCCACCGTDLFLSRDKFDSGTGWPSFSLPVSPLNIRTRTDRSGGMERTEVQCARCGAHLGHVFDDGPPPAGKRYCMNSGALDFIGTADPAATRADSPENHDP